MSKYDKNKAKPSDILPEDKSQRPLMRNNFIMIGISIAMLVLGFVLISGGASGIDQYNPDIFSVRRIVVGPLFCFLGFVLMAIAIIVKPKSK